MPASVATTATRIQAISQSLDQLQQGVSQELSDQVAGINSLARNIAQVNQQIINAQGSGQAPNALLDQRDQLITQLNQWVQTTQIPAADGSVGVFIAGSQALVLGTTVAPLSLVPGAFGDPSQSALSITQGGLTTTLNSDMLGGGATSGLLQFKNQDLNLARNLLGRLTLAVTTSLNAQHALGLDMNGNPGGNLLSPVTLGPQNILQPTAPAQLNAGSARLTLSVSDPSQLEASDYRVNYTSATAGTITRLSDGRISSFDTALANPAVVDGLAIQQSLSAAAGDTYLLKPYSTAAGTVSAAFASPQQLAVASPVAGSMGAANTGSLQLASLVALSNPPANVPVTLTFTGASTYTRSDDMTIPPVVWTYTPTVPIVGTLPATDPPTQWALTLRGAPQPGDTFTVTANPYPHNDSGNATAIMNLANVPMLDGAALTDGYAGLIGHIGVMAQSANYTAAVAMTVTRQAQAAQAGVSGVNLDEEGSNLLKFQQAYQASAQMIQISQTLFNTLLQSLSR